MLDRTPDDTTAKRQRRRRKPPPTPEEREANRIAQAEYRARKRKDVTVFPGRIGPGAINAMTARNRFLGMGRQEAERLARDPEEISKLAYEVLETVWAPEWFTFLRKMRHGITRDRP